MPPKTNVFSHYHFCGRKPCSEPRAPAGSSLSPFRLGWQGSRSPRVEVSPVAWEQGAGEPEGDLTQHALCSEAGSQPCLCWITQRTSPTRPTAGGHFPSGGSFHTGEPFFSECFYPVNSDGDKKNGSQATFWGTDEHIFEEHWKKRNNGRRLGINAKLSLTTCDDAPYK